MASMVEILEEMQLVDYGEAEPEIEGKDMVNSPSHYKLDGLNIESVDVIKAVLGPVMFVGWCLGNALKYMLRSKKKNGLEDLKKGAKNLSWITSSDMGRVIEKQKVLDILARHSTQFIQDGSNYYIMWYKGEVRVDMAYSTNYGGYYFKSREDALKVIELIGEKDLKMYYFCLEDKEWY